MKRRILIIDDDSAFADTVKLALEDTGKYKVYSQLDSGKAIQATHAFMPDLILLDMLMPKLDGSEVMTHLRQDPILWRIPVIIITSLSFNLGNPVERDGYWLMGKPVKLEDLMRCIDERLGVVPVGKELPR